MLARSKAKSIPAPSPDAKRLRMLVVNSSAQLPLAFPDEADAGVTVTRRRLAQVPPMAAESPASTKQTLFRAQC